MAAFTRNEYKRVYQFASKVKETAISIDMIREAQAVMHMVEVIIGPQEKPNAAK